MASAQLSSPRRGGAGSDLKETAPAAPGALFVERGAACGAQGRGGAWPLTRSITRGPARRYDRPGSDRTQAQPSFPAGRAAPSAPALARQAPPPAAATHSGRARGRSASAGRNRPPCTSPVPGPPLLRDARPGERRRLVPVSESSRNLDQVRVPGSEASRGARTARRSGCFVNAPPHSRPPPGSQPTSLPAFQRVINCISGVEKPGQGVPGSQPSLLRDPGARGCVRARCPRRACGLRPKAARGTTRPSRKGEKPVRPRLAVRAPAASAELQARPAPTSSPPGGHAQPAPATRPPALLLLLLRTRP